MDPELPVVVFPVFNETEPLTPLDPELAVFKVNAPLLVEVPYPVERDTEPPVEEVLSPATTMILPPGPNVPLPT
jgi:hypothetical protein